MCVVFRVSVQNGTSELSTAASRTALFAASDTFQEQGGFPPLVLLFIVTVCILLSSCFQVAVHASVPSSSQKHLEGISSEVAQTLTGIQK